jgi:hypothetical protein
VGTPEMEDAASGGNAAVLGAASGFRLSGARVVLRSAPSLRLLSSREGSREKNEGWASPLRWPSRGSLFLASLAWACMAASVTNFISLEVGDPIYAF